MSDDEIRALIVDDEPLARRGIRQLLSREVGVKVVGECSDGSEALRALDMLLPTLVFLDVQMPEVDGFAVIRARGVERMPPVVFVTAHDEFAVRAFETQALDYLVKPLNAARFASTMARVRERQRAGAAMEMAGRLSAMMGLLDAGSSAPRRGAVANSPHPVTGLVVRTTTGDAVLEVAAIDWIEADDYYVRVHVGVADHLLRESLSTLEQRLDPRQFVRVHRGAIVRLDRVREISTWANGKTVAVLRDGTRVPVGRRRQAHLRALIRESVG
jgi:two-component system, LytTR family, response regulator